MPAPANLVHETSTSTGTGNLTVAAVFGRQRFSTAFGTGGTTNVFDYYISSQSAAEWERGTGHMQNATTFVRDTVLESTNANALVNFAAGTKDLMNDLPAAEQTRAAANLAQGAGGVASVKTSRVNLQVEGMLVMADADAAATVAHHVVSLNGVTVPRTLTLPLVSTCNAGHTIRINNTGNNLSAALTVTVKQNAADGGGAVVTILNSPGAWVDVVCDGTAGWYIFNRTLSVERGGTGGATSLKAQENLNLYGPITWKWPPVGATYQAVNTDRIIAVGALAANFKIIMPPPATMIEGQPLKIMFFGAAAATPNAKLTVDAGAGVAFWKIGGDGQSIQTFDMTVVDATVNFVPDQGGLYYIVGGTDPIAGGSGNSGGLWNLYWNYPGDSDYTATPYDRIVGRGPLTADRTVTLASPALCQPGQEITIGLWSPQGFKVRIHAAGGIAPVGASFVTDIFLTQHNTYVTLYTDRDGDTWYVKGGTSLSDIGGMRVFSNSWADGRLSGDADYVAQYDDRGIFYYTLNANRTLTLPDPRTTPAGCKLDVILYYAQGHTLTIKTHIATDKIWGPGLDPVNGVAQIVVTGANGGVGGASVSFINDTTEWFISDGSFNNTVGTGNMLSSANLVEGAGGVASIKTARANLAVDSYANFGDANISLAGTNPPRVVLLSNAFTAPRTLTLPDGNTCNFGTRLTIETWVAINGANTLTIVPFAGNGLGHGNAGVGSIIVSTPGARLEFVSAGGTWWAGVVPVALGGTGARDAAGARSNLGIGTAATYNAGSNGANELLVLDASGLISDSDLPLRLGPTAEYITDWNSATAQLNGWHMGATTLNAPLGDQGWWLGYTQNHGNAGWCAQIVHNFVANTDIDSMTWRRQMRNGVWGAWVRVPGSIPETDLRYFVRVSDAAPVGVPDNTVWFKSDTGQVFIRYNDGNTTQWVSTVGSPGPQGPPGPAGPGSGDMLINGHQTITGGFNVAPYNAGSFGAGSTFTPNAQNGNYQFATNTAASGTVTIAAPAADGAIDILWTNTSGTVVVPTFSGFTAPAAANVLTTAANAKFIISIRRINGFATFSSMAMQ